MFLAAKWWPKRLDYVPNQLLWWLATFALTFVVAALSFRLFETRFLRLKARFPMNGSDAVGAKVHGATGP